MSKLFIVSTKGRVGTVDLTRKLSEKLQASGIEVGSANFSGQFDEGKLSREQIFEKIVMNLEKSDNILFIAGEETADWGALLGVSFALGKKVILLASHESEVPFMAACMRSESLRVSDTEDVDEYVGRLIELIDSRA